MNYESLFATIVVYIGTLWATGIVFYFIGYKKGMKETKEAYFKEEESEDTK